MFLTVLWIGGLLMSAPAPAQDCSGNQGEVGQTASSFIKLHPDRRRFLLCAGEDFKRCFAEFQRQP